MRARLRCANTLTCLSRYTFEPRMNAINEQSPTRVDASGSDDKAEPADVQQVFTQEEAAHFLRFEGARWLDNAPIPWCDVRKPGSTRPIRRYLREDLLEWLRARRVLPGQANPQDQQ